MSGYVLVTPAKNEEAHIEGTILSVLSQSVPPARWTIVSDGSVDGTDAIVRRYAEKHPFIDFLRCDGASGRNFGSKVQAFIAGLSRMAGLDYSFVGNLDADVTFEPGYFEAILAKFTEINGLGIAGGIIVEKVGTRYVKQWIHPDSVAGAVQLFDRRCYEDIGGYLPISLGGIDAAAEIVAKSKGWRVRTFSEIPVRHHRKVAAGKGGIVRGKFRQGMMFHDLGYRPLFHALRCAGRIAEPPFLVASLAMAGGYVWAKARGRPVIIPGNALRYLRRDQMRRLAGIFSAKERRV
jgi:biofilm PGA synthesis N-glycosyltransferase PgaC